MSIFQGKIYLHKKKYQEKTTYRDPSDLSNRCFSNTTPFSWKTTHYNVKIKSYGNFFAFVSQMVSSPLGQKVNSKGYFPGWRKTGLKAGTSLLLHIRIENGAARKMDTLLKSSMNLSSPEPCKR